MSKETRYFLAAITVGFIFLALGIAKAIGGEADNPGLTLYFDGWCDSAPSQMNWRQGMVLPERCMYLGEIEGLLTKVKKISIEGHGLKIILSDGREEKVQIFLGEMSVGKKADAFLFSGSSQQTVAIFLNPFQREFMEDLISWTGVSYSPKMK